MWHFIGYNCLPFLLIFIKVCFFKPNLQHTAAFQVNGLVLTENMGLFIVINKTGPAITGKLDFEIN